MFGKIARRTVTGVIHRDLKPGNVMLARSHRSRQAPVHAKLLDFGLAKTAIGTVDANAAAAQAITAALTTEGTVLRTFQYMAPEQVEGAEADARSDIWAFGCVMYEMVSGARAFTGKSPASLAGNILTAEPAPLTDMKPDLPPALDRIVRKCLAKDPDARWQSARDLGDELKWIRDGRGDIATAVSARRPPLVVHAAWGLALTLAIGAAAWLALRPQELRPPVRLSMTIPIDTPLLTAWPEQLIAVSRDGQRIAYVASVGTRRQLFLRALDQFEPTPIRGTENGTSPAFSPDGESVAFIADGKLKRVELSGSSATVSLAETTSSRGLSWSDCESVGLATARPCEDTGGKVRGSEMPWPTPNAPRRYASGPPDHAIRDRMCNLRAPRHRDHLLYDIVITHSTAS